MEGLTIDKTFKIESVSGTGVMLLENIKELLSDGCLNV